MRTLSPIFRQAFLLILIGCAWAFSAAQAHAQTSSYCNGPGTYNTVGVGAYNVQTNYWNGACTGTQCVTIDGATGAFGVTESTAACGPTVASYPSIYYGCHYGNESTGSVLPLLVSSVQCASSSWNFTPDTTAGDSYDIAYDIWFAPASHPTCADDSGGYANGAELMIWLNYMGDTPVPNASVTVATDFSLAGYTWNLYETPSSTLGWTYMSYQITSNVTSVTNLNLSAFFNDALARGYISSTWYLAAVEAGIELRNAGAPFVSNSYSVSINGSCPPTATPTPTQPTSTPTGTATNTATNSPSPTASSSATATPTLTVTRTPTPTPTASPSATPTLTASSTSSGTATSTASGTPTKTATSTATGTPTSSATLTPTSSGTATASFTSTLTASYTLTASATASQTLTASQTPTGTPSSTPSGTATSTVTNSPTHTSTVTATNTGANTATLTPTSTPTATASSTPTSTTTSTPTMTASSSPTQTSSFTTTSSTTSTASSSPTRTGTATPTWTGTLSPSMTFTPSSTPTLTPTLTSTPTAASTATNSTTATASNTPVDSSTPTSTPSFTLTSTATASPTFTPTVSPTHTSATTPASTPTLSAASTPTAQATALIYPNPVYGPGPVTLKLVLSSPVNQVALTVYTTAFRKVNTLTEVNLPAGTDDIAIPLTDKTGVPLANGLYYVVVQTPKSRIVLKLLALH